jgi:Bardet-Biedl syndrome 5 protein
VCDYASKGAWPACLMKISCSARGIMWCGLCCREEDVEIVDPGDKGDFLAAYYADATKAVDRDPVFNADLGLAIEGLRDNLTIEQLWNVI